MRPAIVEQPLIEPLTDRELDVLRLMADGLSNNEIASRLVIALSTVKWYVQQVYGKLGVNNRRQVIAVGQRLGLLEGTPERRDVALPDWMVGHNPYKGLAAFQQADAPDFFGRETLIEQLVARLQDHDDFARFLAVVGPSGSGKSSVVRAGLLPALKRGAVPESDNWFVVDMLPGAYPLDRLEVALMRVAAKPQAGLMEQLQRDARGLSRAAELILPEDGQLLLVIDQFEELFTLVDDPAVTRHVLDLIYATVTDPRSRVRVIITLRADFYDRPLMYPDFSELVRRRTEVVVPLNPEELEQAIVKPAEMAGVTVEPGLVAALVAEVHEQPGTLPLLEYALTELFERRQGRTMTLAVYQTIGGALGVLTRQADEVYDDLSDAEQNTARQGFLRLVTLGEGTEDVRRRVLLSELSAVGTSQNGMEEVLDLFGEYRLLTFDRDPATREPTVEVAHEALIQRWEKLRAWIDDSRADIRQQRLLAAAVAEWGQAGHENSYLLSGSRLAQFEEWAEQTDVALTPSELSFLDASIAERQRQESAEQERQQRELETQRQLAAQQRRAANRLRYLVAGLTIFLTVAILLVILALNARSTAQQQRNKAEREAAVNHSLVLAGSAEERFKAGNADLALALALEAVKIDAPPPEAGLALSTVALGPGTRAILRESGGEAKTVAFSPDSRWALSGGCAELSENACGKGELILWDLETNAELRHLEGYTGWVNHVAFNPVPGDGPLTALSASSDGTLILWNVETGEIIRSFVGHTGGVNTVVFDSTGQQAVSGSDDGTLILWKITTGEIIRRFVGHTGPVNCVVFSPDGSFIASGSEDKTIVLWDVETGALRRQLTGHDTGVRGLMFRTDSQGHVTLFSASYDTVEREWDIDTGELLRSMPVPSFPVALAMTPDGRTFVSCEGNGCELWDAEQLSMVNPLYYSTTDVVSSGALSPDGRLFLISFRGGALILMNMPVSSEIRRFDGEGGLLSVSVSPDGHYLLTGSYSGGRVILWDLQTGLEVRRLEGLEEVVTFAAFSPDGKQALIGSGDAWRGTPARRLVLWDVDTGQIIHELKGFEFYPRQVAFSADGRTALVGTDQWGGAWEEQGDGELILYDLETGADIRHYEPVGSVYGIAFSRDGRFVLSGNELSGMNFWNVETGQLVRSFDYAIWGLVRMPDADQFLATTADSTILLDPATGAVLRRFVGFDAAGLALGLSPDGSRLLSGSATGTFALWNVQTGAKLHRFTGYRSGAALWNLVFSPDGQTAFSSAGGPGEAVIEWQITDWPLDTLLAWVHENRYVRDLTCDERAQYRIDPLCK
jgi:WD40 repeat protein/DNA-binding CsgD family transcriptional regulator